MCTLSTIVYVCNSGMLLYIFHTYILDLTSISIFKLYSGQSSLH